LHVGAKDKATGKENKITIKANSGLTEAEIQKMVKDAELNAEEDHKLRELAESRNQADALVHSTKKSLTEYGDKLEAGEKATIETAIAELETSLKSADKAEIDAKVAALSTASQKLGEKMYADQQAQQQAAGGAEGGQHAGAESAKQDDVVDADFKEVKDAK
jgi:molecular chaperone DnaK